MPFSNELAKLKVSCSATKLYRDNSEDMAFIYGLLIVIHLALHLSMRLAINAIICDLC